MTTDKQIQANRQNAGLGGVKTPEGKAITRYNALRHGLLSKEVLLEGEDEQSLIELGKRLQQELAPATELEILLVDRIVANMWRLRRVLEVERNAMEFQKAYKDLDLGVDFGLEKNIGFEEKQKMRRKTRDMITNSGIEEIMRYETSIERGIYKALHELQRIQAVRAGENPPTPLAVDIDISKGE